MLNYVAALWRRTKLERELQQLDDRLLNDIGINRGEIASVVQTSVALGRPATVQDISFSYRENAAA